MHKPGYPLYILHDANGFVTACAAEPGALALEVARRPLTAPIRIHHWVLNGMEWVCAKVFMWEATGATWF